MAEQARPTRPIRAWLRLVLPALVVLVWLTVTVVGGQTFGKISEVTSDDQTTFLPAEAESTIALGISERFSEDDAVPATVIAVPNTGSVPQHMAQVQEADEAINELDGVLQTVGPQPSGDEAAVQILVLLDQQAADEGIVKDLRDAVRDTFSSDSWTAYVTGPAALSDDLSSAFAGVDGLLLLVAVVAVFIILVVVYRSPLLPFLVLLSSVAALCAAVIVIFEMAQREWIQLNGQAQGILSILVIGAATDYSLLLVARYREELQRSDNRYLALWHAWRRSAPAVLASGGTVALALLCLLFSDLNSNRALGPVTSAGIVFSMIATLTFLPALLALFGRPLFWPRIPRASVSQEQADETSGVWASVGSWVRSRPRPIWVVVTLVLMASALGVLDLRAEGVAQSDQVLGETDAKAGQALLEEHFDAGTGSPATIFVPVDEAEEALEIVTEAAGVGQASVTGSGGAPADGLGDALEIDATVEISATLTDPGDSIAAENTVRELRAGLSSLQGETFIGGTSAAQLDTNETAQRDLITVIPIVLVVVFLILTVLLRALVAPLVLLVTTVISYLSALGISALVFNYLFGFPGADATVPLFGFMFLVALGVDYNIFLTTRAREETHRRGPREGLLYALVVTGGVITSAGVVLAATFTALAVLPLMFMVQLAFLVALGVLIDTFLVRTLQVPALGVDLGSSFWWPARVTPDPASIDQSHGRSR